jgi:signal transduction histidine kinase
MQNDLQQKSYLIIQRIIFSGSLFLLISIFMSMGLVKILTRPLILARNAAMEISNGNFSQEIIYVAKDEIGQLVDTLNSMAKHLQQSFDQLNQKNEKLIALNQDKNEFLGIAAHDLKNPLSGILGLSDCILESNGEITTEELMEYTGLIKDSAERMFLIVTNLLDVNKLESGKIDANLKFTNILPIIQKSYQDYQERAKLKQLTMHLVADEPVYVAYIDDELFYQIVDNLISNAIKYSPLAKNVYVRLIKTETTVRCEIQDEGTGLTVTDQEKLFGKFQRLSTQPTGGEHSTGLGLFIVKKLVEAQRGRVWCESKVGQGANFIVEFPSMSTTNSQQPS